VDVDDAPEEQGRSDRRLPVAALVVGLLAVVVAVAIQPSIVTGGAESVQAVAVALALGVVFAAFVVLVFWKVRSPLVVAALVGGPPLVLAAVLTFTALVDDEADDEQAEQLATELAQTETTGAPPPESDEGADVPTTTTAPPGPVRLSSGTFLGLDDHSATGTVSLVEQPDGSRVVLFEDFEVERGPDYLVYLVPGEANFDAGAGVEIAPLQGNVGDQQYAVPPELADQQPLTVLIWCRAFDVNIAGSTV
jgi:uncharacterized membrane protein